MVLRGCALPKGMTSRKNFPSNFSYAAPRRIADASARRSARGGQAPTFSTRQFHPKTPKNVYFCRFSGHFAHFSPIFTHFRPFPPFFPRGGRRALQAGSVSPPACRPSGTWRVSAKGRDASPRRPWTVPACGTGHRKNGFEGVRVAERHDLPSKLPEQFFLRHAPHSRDVARTPRRGVPTFPPSQFRPKNA